MVNARYLRLLVYLILGLLLGANIVIAHAETIPAPQGYRLSGYSDYFSTPQSACESHVTNFDHWTQSTVYPEQGYCYKVGDTNVQGTTLFSYYCPSGSTKSGSGSSTVCSYTTSCPTGTLRDASGSCVPDCISNPDDKVGQPLNYIGGHSATVCDGSCSYSVVGAVQVCTSDGKCYGQYGSKTGSSCTSSTLATGNTTEYDCLKQGKSYGVVNGVTVCLAPGTAGSTNVTSSPPPSTSTTDAGGNSTNTTTNTTYTVNNNGTVTTTTTTTVTTNGASPVTTTEQKEQGKDDFCSQNPQVSICKNGTFSGGCGNFVCDGDGIQCAIAREQHERNCKLFDTATPLSTLGDALGTGSDPDGKLDEFKTASVVHLPGVLDQTNPYSQAGLSDLVVQIGNGHSVTIPFTNLNFYLELMGHILIALSLLAAGRIVGAY